MVFLSSLCSPSMDNSSIAQCGCLTILMPSFFLGSTSHAVLTTPGDQAASSVEKFSLLAKSYQRLTPSKIPKKIQPNKQKKTHHNNNK